MRSYRFPLALLVMIALMAATAATVAAHNAGCVQTGNDEEWVFVGSNKNAPEVAEQNPNSSTLGHGSPGENVLDRYPSTAGDQYGARYAADQGASADHGSAVQTPSSERCQASGPRAENQP